MTKSLQQFLAAVRLERAQQEAERPDSDVISVSETVSVAASVYETVRNTLEYDEDHRLRRNAIRRILKRKLYEAKPDQLAEDMLRELIWARYLPNKQVPEARIAQVSVILTKYRPLFVNLNEEAPDCQDCYHWLLDLIATEIEQLLAPPVVDEALASFAYQELKPRMKWVSNVIAPEDQDLQLYIAIHRTVLKSDLAHTRFRVFTLYYPDWKEADPDAGVINEIGDNLRDVMHSVEAQLVHPGSDAMFRLIRRYAFIFRVLRDIAEDNPETFAAVVENHDLERLDTAIAKASKERYQRFKHRLSKLVLRAVFFLFLTKMILALLIEFPYEYFILRVSNYTPLVANIVFHPLLLGVIGMTTRMPGKKNTTKLTEYIHSVIGAGDPFDIPFKVKHTGGALTHIFNGIYALALVVSVGILAWILHALAFNVVSILFFLFFLSLVMFLGLKIRYSKRELLVVDIGGGVISTIIDVAFLPIVRVGRWLSLQAPKVNVFLFFFDFIIEAPFKATIRLIEGWLGFLREKKEEI